MTPETDSEWCSGWMTCSERKTNSRNPIVSTCIHTWCHSLIVWLFKSRHQCLDSRNLLILAIDQPMLDPLSKKNALARESFTNKSVKQWKNYMKWGMAREVGPWAAAAWPGRETKCIALEMVISDELILSWWHLFNALRVRPSTWPEESVSNTLSSWICSPVMPCQTQLPHSHIRVQTG